ncbi:MAG: pseudouridine synthase, partial [Planctomycetota bacterium]
MKKRPRENAPTNSSESHLIRLQRVLASAGLGSRRDCETLITEGRVEVDGRPCTELGTRVDPETQEIRVDGEKVRGQKLQYFMLNKPAGVLSTNEDPDGRTRVVDLIKTDLRVYNVGRLDQSSEGLIVVTNDGDLAFRLTHPKFGVEKRYLVQCVGFPTTEQLEQLERGVYLAEGKAKVERVSIKKKHRTGAILEMVLTEGRNREIRRVLASIGHKVTRLKRIAIGPLQLGELAVGAHRRLTLEEIQSLKKAAAGGAKPFKKKPSASTGPARTIGHLKARQERAERAGRPERQGRFVKGGRSDQQRFGGPDKPRGSRPAGRNFAPRGEGFAGRDSRPTSEGDRPSARGLDSRRPNKRGAEFRDSRSRGERTGGPGEGVRDSRGSGFKGPGFKGRGTRGPSTGGAKSRGPGSKGPDSRGPGSRGPGSRGPGSRGPSSRGSSSRG